VQLLVGQKKFADALQEYDGVWRESSEDRQLQYDFGFVTVVSGQRMDDGLAAFRRCLALVPAGAEESRARAEVHWRMGTVWERKGQPEAARAEYLAALKELPDFRPAKQALEKLGGGKT
jgi:hypothetical protein